MAKRKSNSTIHSEGREIIASVIEACDKEKKQNHLLVPLTKATERAAVYTGVGVTSIKTIRKENNIRNEGSADRRLISPGKKRTVSRRNAVKIDEFDMGVIRNAIFDFYIREKQVPTVSTMLPIIKEKINFPWGEKSLWRLMKKMGFRWKKCNSKRKVLIERADIVDWRSRYLVQMRKLREEGREIVYIDETWIDNSLVVKKCWQHDDIIGVTANISASVRLIVVHAGGNNGFINGAELIFKAGSASGDYHGHMNQENFEKWVREKLLENLPSNAVIVLDNAPYHSVVANKTPTAYSVKRDLIQWLNAKGLHVHENLRKPELYQLVLQLKPKNKIYKIDELFTSRGHSVIRLPPYMCELNPIEMAWAKIKRLIKERNVNGDMSTAKLLDLTNWAITQVTTEDWMGYCSHVTKLENEYWERDGIVPDIIDSIVINMDSDNECEESENSDSSSMDSD